MHRHLHRLALVLLSLAPLLAAQKPDLIAAERELDAMFQRPQGKPIGEEQKAALGAWLEQHRGQNLGHLGYAAALHCYLARDYDGAVAELDRFFATETTIRNQEHKTMAGRIYLNAVRLEGAKEPPDLARLTKWGQNMTRLYDDVATLARQSRAVTQRLKDPAAFRVALAQGVFQATLPDASKDEFLKALYGDAAPAARPGAVPATPIRRSGAEPAAPAAAGVVQVGQPVTNFATDKVLNGPAAFDLESYRGKVVVLDFFATWCPPCRASVPSLVALQKELGAEVQVVAVTRFHGRGMDFSDPAAALPHGGKSVSSLDHDQEVAVNEAFVKAFAVNYPVVFATGDVAQTRFGVTGIPTAFVIDRAGNLAGKVVGGNEEQHAALRELVAAARKGK